MDGHIFTTEGWLPADQVRLSVAVTENDNCKVTRTDKFIYSHEGPDGPLYKWVGNDVHVEMKKGLGALFEQGVFH